LAQIARNRGDVAHARRLESQFRVDPDLPPPNAKEKDFVEADYDGKMEQVKKAFG
jgi:hypothetical protein